MEVLLSRTEDRKSPRKARKRKDSEETQRKKKQKHNNNNNKLLAFEFDDEEEDVKPSSKQRSSGNGNDSGTQESEDEEELPLSRLTTRKKTKKRKSAASAAVVVVQETESDGDGDADGLGFGAHGGGGDDEEEMVPAAHGGVPVDDDLLLTPFSGFQTQETEDGDALEAQERRVKPRAASSLPIAFGEKVTKTKVLLECEGDAVDFSGDMGAVGRFTVDHNQEISLDLKGVIYKTTIVPSNTFFVVNVGQTEAKVECIMSDFVQLREETNCNENETMVEGTLKDFGFDSDEEREHLAVDGGEKADTTTGKAKQEEGADNGEPPKKKGKATKPLKSSKVPTKRAVAGKSKGGRVASAKGVGKKHIAKATKPKASKKG